MVGFFWTEVGAKRFESAFQHIGFLKSNVAKRRGGCRSTSARFTQQNNRLVVRQLGEPIMLEKLIQRNKKTLNFVNSTCSLGWKALHHAAVANAFDAMEVLLNHGANPRAKTVRGQTPLHLAVMNMTNTTGTRGIELLSCAGGDQNAQNSEGSFSPLR